MKKDYRNYLILSVIFSILAYLVTNFWLQIPGEDALAKLSHSSNLGATAQDIFKTWWLLLYPNFYSLIIAFLAFLVQTYFYYKNKGNYRFGEESGSARFATRKEMDHYADKDPEYNIILSKQARMGLINKRLPMDYQRNKNLTIIGGPGSGKTFTFVKPNIMQMNATYIVTDPKGLLVRETGKMLENHGYKIKIFDLSNLGNSNTFNAFNYMHSEKDIQTVAAAIGTAVGEDEAKQDMWSRMGATLIRSLIGLLYFDGIDKGYTPNLRQVSDLLNDVDRKNKKIPSPVEDAFEELEQRRPGNYATKQFKNFQATAEADETKAGVVTQAVSIFSAFDLPEVANMIAEDSMDIESWNEEKTAVFIAINELDNTFNWLASVLVSTIMRTLAKKADDVLQGLVQTKKPLLHVRFILDEFANIGKLPNIKEALGTFRSREMSIVIVLQALDNLKSMYKDNWGSLLQNTDTILFLGSSEKDTLDYLSQRAGKQTINQKNYTFSKSGTSESRSTASRDLMTPDEIARVGSGKALVFIAGEYVFFDDKFLTLQHQRASELADSPEDDNWYNYKRYINHYEEMWALAQADPDKLVDHGVLDEALVQEAV